MGEPYDLVVRDAYLYDRDGVFDVAVADGTIVAVGDALDGRGGTEIDAEGDLVAPGFVDSHVHMDKAFSASGGRFPGYNDRGTNFDTISTARSEYYAETSPETITENAVELGRRMAANGTSYVRTHAYLDGEVGTAAVEAVLDARERLSDLLDVQVVAMPASGVLGNEDVVREALELGADVVGGADPATRSGDVERAIDTWFEIAAEYGVEVDPHIQHPSTLGVHVLHRMAEKAVEHGYEGDVTASHGYCLAEMDGLEFDVDTPGLVPAELKTFRDGQLDRALAAFEASGLKFVTCHPSTRPGMPIAEFAEHDIPLGWGCDNVHDWIVRHAQPDALQGALVNAFKLDYNQYTFATNRGLDLLWRMATEGGARVLSVGDDYGVREGTPADLVVFDEPSPQWAIINQATRRYVLKRGTVVAEDGTVTVAV